MGNGTPLRRPPRARRTAFRLLLAAAAAAMLPAGNCNGNLGDVTPGPKSFRVSVGSNGAEADGASVMPSISGDGRHVVFASKATNLAPPTSSYQEIFFRDRFADTVRNITILSARESYWAFQGSPFYPGDCEEPFLSADGRFVAFLSSSDLPNNTGSPQFTKNLMVFDSEEVSAIDSIYSPIQVAWPDADIEHVSISADGSKIAFSTQAANLGFDPLGQSQVYVLDNPAGTLTLISRDLGGLPTDAGNLDSVQPEISADGQTVVFASRATNLTPDPTGGQQQIFLSASDASGSIELVSRGDGNPGAISDDRCFQPSVSADGRYVSFIYNGFGTLMGSPSPDHPMVLRRDRTAFRTEIAGDDAFVFFSFAERTRTSDDGRFVSYLGLANTGLPATIDDFYVAVRDMEGPAYRPSTSLFGGILIFTGFSSVQLSGDGRWLVWSSQTNDQVIGDTNNSMDIFGYGPLR